jgi:hypothetical protein
MSRKLPLNMLPKQETSLTSSPSSPPSNWQEYQRLLPGHPYQSSHPRNTYLTPQHPKPFSKSVSCLPPVCSSSRSTQVMKPCPKTVIIFVNYVRVFFYAVSVILSPSPMITTAASHVILFVTRLLYISLSNQYNCSESCDSFHYSSLIYLHVQ